MAAKKRPTKADRAFVRRINETRPTREQMAEYAKACGELPREFRGFEGHVVAWAQLYPGKRAEGQSAHFRMQALARTFAELPASGWAEPFGVEGGLLTLKPLFEAAAEEPVILRDGEVMFDRASLLRRAFQLAKRER